MSCIFKGDSIYKSGGGGGGYKDGGQLVDGDFIKVENNTVSSYDNVSRDPVNFYFDYKDGEIFNSIIELTTAVNATINVYYIKNGLYFPLGFSTPNSVEAGKDYNVTITGKTIFVDEVTNADAPPAFDEVDGVLWRIHLVKDNLFITEDLGIGRKYQANQKEKKGWHLATNNEITAFQSAFAEDSPSFCAISGWIGTPGTNTTGIGLKPDGYEILVGGQYWNTYKSGEWSMFFISRSSNIPYFSPTGGGILYDEPTKINIRLFKNIDY